jgi:hypothetical protein
MTLLSFVNTALKKDHVAQTCLCYCISGSHHTSHINHICVIVNFVLVSAVCQKAETEKTFRLRLFRAMCVSPGPKTTDAFRIMTQKVWDKNQLSLFYRSGR